jgi:cytochrome c5
MSDPHDAQDSHEGPIRTPRQLVWTVVASFVVPVVVIILLVNFVAVDTRPAAGSDGLGPQAVATRIQPVGTVELRDASAPAVLRTGQQVYVAQCTACHSAGVAGAPRVGDNAAWAPRIRTGFEAMLAAVINGKGAMPPQGGGDASEFELGRAVVYMVNNSGGNLPEPAAPVAAAAASAPN